MNKIILAVGILLQGAFLIAAQKELMNEGVPFRGGTLTAPKKVGAQDVRTALLHAGKRVRNAKDLAGHRELYCSAYDSKDAEEIFDKYCKPEALNENVMLYGAFFDTQLVGSLFVLKELRGCAKIMLLGVAPLRRMGIASFLLSTFVYKATKHYGITELDAFVSQNNTPARLFLESRGFAHSPYALAREEQRLKDMKTLYESGRALLFSGPIRIGLQEQHLRAMRQGDVRYVCELEALKR